MNTLGDCIYEDISKKITAERNEELHTLHLNALTLEKQLKESTAECEVQKLFGKYEEVSNEENDAWCRLFCEHGFRKGFLFAKNLLEE